MDRGIGGGRNDGGSGDRASGGSSPAGSVWCDGCERGRKGERRRIRRLRRHAGSSRLSESGRGWGPGSSGLRNGADISAGVGCRQGSRFELRPVATRVVRRWGPKSRSEKTPQCRSQHAPEWPVKGAAGLLSPDAVPPPPRDRERRPNRRGARRPGSAFHRAPSRESHPSARIHRGGTVRDSRCNRKPRG